MLYLNIILAQMHRFFKQIFLYGGRDGFRSPRQVDIHPIVVVDRNIVAAVGPAHAQHFCVFRAYRFQGAVGIIGPVLDHAGICPNVGKRDARKGFASGARM